MTFTVSCTKEHLTTATTENITTTTDVPVTFREEGDCNCYFKIISVENVAPYQIWGFYDSNFASLVSGAGSSWYNPSSGNYEPFPTNLYPLNEGIQSFFIFYHSTPSENFTIHVRFECYDEFGDLQTSRTWDFIWKNGFQPDPEIPVRSFGLFDLNCTIIEIPYETPPDDKE